MRWLGHVVHMGEMKNTYKSRKAKCKWEDNIKIYLKEIGCEGVDWNQVAQNRVQWQAVVNVILNLWIP